MGYAIVWTSTALKNFNKNIVYLQEEWTEKEVAVFVTRVSDYLATLRTATLMDRPIA